MTHLRMAVRPPRRVVLAMQASEASRTLEQALCALGCEVVESAGDRPAARERCARLLPELVLIDLQLDAHGGALALAAELAASSSAPILYLTEPDAALPKSAGAHAAGFIDKPASPRRLARSIGFALEQRASLALAGAREPAAVSGTGARGTSANDSASSRFRDELLGSMAHELRAPLQGVVGFAGFLIDGKAGTVSDAQRQYLEHIATGANHVLQVVNDVLDLTSSESDSLHIRTEAVDAERAMREVLQVLQVIAIRKHVGVDVEVDEQLGHVVSDATKVKQVLYNLVSNALKFTPTGGRVRVCLRRAEPDAFCIDVEDSGSGIPADLLPHLFERSPARSALTQGIGLLLTQRIVDALGGSLSGHNREQGGFCCSARLPLAPSVAQRDTTVRLPRDAR
jgi:signal transduction histidine kinase